MDFKEDYDSLLQNIKIMPISAVSKTFRKIISNNPDVTVWLGKVGYATRPGYLCELCYFLKCVGIKDPTVLLDLKTHENVKKRFFPAERLVETWQSKAHLAQVKAHVEKKVLDAVRSFFKFNRVSLVQIKCSYRPKPKTEVSDEELRTFREALSPVDTVLFDFLLSVPLRDGQFQTCPNCGRDFHPRWQNIQTYPKIEPYSSFIIAPEKGHENNKYPEGLKQVCFLTETAAKGLITLRALKEKQLARIIQPDEYIFTYSRNIRKGQKNITPKGQITVQSMFWNAQQKTGIHVYSHLLRTWVNTRLGTCGIDKQIRDIYLGHMSVQNEEEGYVMQMLPKWREALKKAHAIESLDLVQGIISPAELQDKLTRIDEQQREIQSLKSEIDASKLSKEQLEMISWFTEKLKQHKVRVER
jgi:hypothetical protein